MVFWSIRTTRKRHSRGKWPGTKWGPRARGYTDSVLAGNTGDAIDRETESRNSFRISLVSRPMAKNQLTNHPKGRLWKIVLILDRVKKERGNSERCKTRLVEARIFNRGRNLFVRETSEQNRCWRGQEPAENRRIVPHWRIFSSSRPRYFIQLLEWTRAKRTIRTEGKKEKTRKKGRKEGCRKDEGKKRVENWSLREETWSFVCGRMITVRVTMTRRKRSISLWEM